MKEERLYLVYFGFKVDYWPHQRLVRVTPATGEEDARQRTIKCTENYTKRNNAPMEIKKVELVIIPGYKINLEKLVE